MERNNIGAIILAGGRGMRLRPLTGNMPKPMVPILDKPVLQLIVSSLVRAGITRIAVTLGYLPERIISYFGDGSRLGAKLSYFTESKPLGTAGALKNAESFINGTFVVMSGDALTDLNVKSMLDFHQSAGGEVTMAVKKVKDPRGMGEVILDGSGKIVRFREKPERYESGLVNTGMYVMEPEVLERIPPERESDLSRDVFPFMLDKLRAFETDCYWSDIGTLLSYYRANMDAARKPQMFGLSV